MVADDPRGASHPTLGDSAYARACINFFAWCERRGLALAAIRPFDVAAYVEKLQAEVSPPSV
jgi:hypothetical protein